MPKGMIFLAQADTKKRRWRPARLLIWLLLLGLLSVCSWLLLPRQRSLLLLGALGLCLLAALLHRPGQKRPFLLASCYLLALLSLFHLFYTDEVRVIVEGSRMQVLGSAYQRAGNAVLEQVSRLPVGRFRELPEDTVSPLLSLHGRVYYTRQGDATSLYFPLQENFFHSFGYLYRVKPDLIPYERTYALGDHWYYAKPY